VLSKLRKYKVIVLKNNNIDMTELNINKIFIFSCSFILIFITMMFTAFYSTEIGNILALSEVRKHKQNNSILEQKIKEQDEEIKLLLDNIISIKKRDENLRELLKLPSIDDDIRKLGVGGGNDSIKNLNDLNYLLPSEFDLNLIKKHIDFVERSINLEILSYNEIEQKVNNELDYFLHYPAIYPVLEGKKSLSSRYGYRRDPFTKKRRFHDGDDFSCKIGVPVIATANGTVKASKRYGSFGNYIEIDHGNGFTTVYAHLSKRLVKKGDKVNRGDKIGNLGNTGRSTAPHLHYEVLYNKKHVNPNKFYFDINT
tara:strand:+ start:12121 stop:13056 length:936 start_codon:yes stop_codon:yes gene_type:complete